MLRDASFKLMLMCFSAQVLPVECRVHKNLEKCLQVSKNAKIDS